MQNYILHGDDQVGSRRRLGELVREARAKNWEITRVDGKTATISELATLARTQGLINLGHLVVVENFLSSRKEARKVLENITKSETVFVFWEGKKIRPPAGIDAQEFKIPAAVFKFLDSFVPKNAAASHRFLKNIPAEELETLHYRIGILVRELIWIKEDPKSFTLPPQRQWVRKKLEGQARRWRLGELLYLHAKLLELDRQNKRSQLPENLSASLDLLVAEL